MKHFHGNRLAIRRQFVFHLLFIFIILFAIFGTISYIYATFHVIFLNSSALRLFLDNKYSRNLHIKVRNDEDEDGIRRLVPSSGEGTDWQTDKVVASRETIPLLPVKLPLVRVIYLRRTLAATRVDDCPYAATSYKSSSSTLFPKDLFTMKQRRHGALLFHFFGLIYMFIALSIVCDDFFVPSLSVLIKKLSISENVAGATFMAAGGSAPEFFTSLFGVFITQNNVGIGTIVGSASFNILCVLAFCTLFAREILKLTWWPMFRDSSFYMFAIFMLLLFFMDEKIEWYEALSMLFVYVIYGIVMKYDENLEKAVKVVLCKIIQNVSLSPSSVTLEHGKSVPTLQSGVLYRSGVVSLAKISDSIGALRSNDKTKGTIEISRGNATQSNCQKTTVINLPEIELPGTVKSAPKNDENNYSSKAFQRETSLRRKTGTNDHAVLENRVEETEKPVDISWPSTTKSQLSYLFMAPVMLPLYFTLPDTKNPSSRKYFVVTFIGSILWIAFFSYLMIWWATVIGETLNIPDEVMGLTLLAAGTSIPDLITSVIVARKGFGDMAVSSSIGSNLFDICIGLPIPWLLQLAIQKLNSAISTSYIGTIPVVSKGLICSVGLLFLMLIVLITAAAISRWKMDRLFGVVMMVAYLSFCIFSVLLELGYVICPLSVGCR